MSSINRRLALALPVAWPPLARLGARIAISRPPAAVFVAYAASRAVVLLAALLQSLFERNPNLVPGSGGPLIDSLTTWDGWWYLGIERSGYHAAPLVGQYHDYAFFPLYPALIRLLSIATPAFDGLVAVLLSNVCFLIALWLLYALTREVLDDDRAVRACVLLAIFPFSWVFSMAYGESLFLALSLASLLAAERGHAGRAAVLASLAGLVRLPGVLLGLPLALILWRRVADRRRLAWLLVVPVGALGFVGFVANLTGALNGYNAAQGAWGRSGVGTAAAGGESLANSLDLLRLSFLVTLLVYVFLLVYLRGDRIPLAYALLPIITLGTVFLSGNLQSIGRLGMVAFPYVWILAGRSQRWFRVAWPVVSVGLLGVLSVAVFTGWYQP